MRGMLQMASQVLLVSQQRRAGGAGGGAVFDSPFCGRSVS